MDDKCGGKTFDGVMEGEVRSEPGEKGFFHYHEDGFSRARVTWDTHGEVSGVSGAVSLPFKGVKTVKMVRPPHNSGVKL